MLNWEKSVRLKNIAMRDHLPAARHAVWRLCRGDRGKHGITARVLHAQDRNALGAGKQASTKAQAELQGMGLELYPNAQAALLPNKAGKG